MVLICSRFVASAFVRFFYYMFLNFRIIGKYFIVAPTIGPAKLAYGMPPYHYPIVSAIFSPYSTNKSKHCVGLLGQ